MIDYHYVFFVFFNRLVSQLIETNQNFTDFWLKHEKKLAQCLQLRQFEEDFRPVGGQTTKCFKFCWSYNQLMPVLRFGWCYIYLYLLNEFIKIIFFKICRFVSVLFSYTVLCQNTLTWFQRWQTVVIPCSKFTHYSLSCSNSKKKPRYIKFEWLYMVLE